MRLVGTCPRLLCRRVSDACSRRRKSHLEGKGWRQAGRRDIATWQRLTIRASLYDRRSFIALRSLRFLLLRWIFPVPLATDGTLLLYAGLALAGIGFWGRAVMVAAHTNLDPAKPTTAIVSGGPFRFTRNPLYVGMTMSASPSASTRGRDS